MDGTNTTDVVGLRWTETLACYMRRSTLEISTCVATFPPERWTRRIREWNGRRPRKRGEPAYTWETVLQKYSTWKGFDNWIVQAAASVLISVTTDMSPTGDLLV